LTIDRRITPDVTLTNEGADQIVEGIAIDNAGNTNFTSVVVSMDKTPPTIMGFPAVNEVAYGHRVGPGRMMPREKWL
jgi:hypothetical protein